MEQLVSNSVTVQSSTKDPLANNVTTVIIEQQVVLILDTVFPVNAMVIRKSVMSRQASVSTASTTLMEITVSSVTLDTMEMPREETHTTVSSVRVQDLTSPITLQLLVKSVMMD